MDGHAPTLKTFRAFFPFGGIGGGAIGFADAAATLARAGVAGRFEIVGGLDFDEGAAADFETFTGAPCERADVRAMTPERLRALCGYSTPDVIFASPPCKGASGLLGNEKAETEAYREMNRLLLVWTELMLTTWAGDLPSLVIYENVPRITSRAKDALAAGIKALRAAGYVLHAGTHNCGEVGGLAQNRTRFLLVARLQKKVPNLVFQPPRQRVRGCGEVLGTLPLPNDPAGGAMHQLPDICLLNWFRLALIPPGGDWRNIEGALAAHEKRREHWCRYAVSVWSAATPAVVGSGTNGTGLFSVADPRVPDAYPCTYGVLLWGAPTHTITGKASTGTGPFSVADPRLHLGPNGHTNIFALSAWDVPARTITGSTRPSSGAVSIADPRVADAFNGAYGVHAWSSPSTTITSSEGPGSAACSIADPRIESAFNGAYGMLVWSEPSRTVIGGTSNGGCFVADPRLTCTPRENSGAYGVLHWQHPSFTVTGSACFDNGRFAIADPRGAAAATDATPPKPTRGTRRRKGPPRRGVARATPRPRGIAWRLEQEPGIVISSDARVPGSPSVTVRFRATRFDVAPPYVPVLRTESGCWHRPLTTWELLALQSFPTHIGGVPVVLSGTNTTDWRERIGNAVPPAAARAIAVQFLLTLLHASVGDGFALGGAGGVWVRGRPAPAWARALGVLSLYPERSKAAARRCGSVAPLEPGDPWATNRHVSQIEGRA